MKYMRDHRTRIIIGFMNILFFFPTCISCSFASVDIAGTINIVRNFTFPLLAVSIIILFYCLMRLLEYRRIIDKKTEELRESEERYALAAQGSNDGLWDWNLKTNKVYYSPRWKQMIGYDDDEIGEDPNDWFALVHPDDVENLKNIIGSKDQHGITIGAEIILFLDGNFVGMHKEIISCKSGDHHQ